MKSVILTLLLVIFLPFCTYANEQPSPIDQLNQISDEALQMVKSSRYDDARRLLEYFSDRFLFLTKEDSHTLSADELRIVTIAHNEAVESMAVQSMNHEKRVNSVTKLRLVIDAASSAGQPLWTQLEQPVMSAFSLAKEFAYKGDMENFHVSLNAFLSLYEIIYPSARLNVPIEKIQRVDALVDYIDQYRPLILANESGQSELKSLEYELESLFSGMKEDEADPSLWWVIATTGGIIISTLVYVGWRKYVGDRKKERGKNRM